ncbi:MAG: hypothetical protein ACTHON_06480, partial [Humibacter sp.]
KAASKAFTDEETEDEALDGYLPLTRWASRPGAAVAAGAPSRPALTGTPIPFDAASHEDESHDDEPDDDEADDVYVLGEGTPLSPEAIDQTGPGSGAPDESSTDGSSTDGSSTDDSERRG